MGARARLLAGVPAGVVATVTMDGAMVAAAVLGGEAFNSKRTDLAVIGRWAGGLPRGRWRHGDASREDPGALDVPLGLMTHYLAGIVLTEAFVLFPWRRRFTVACGLHDPRSGAGMSGSMRLAEPPEPCDWLRSA